MSRRYLNLADCYAGRNIIRYLVGMPIFFRESMMRKSRIVWAALAVPLIGSAIFAYPNAQRRCQQQEQSHQPALPLFHFLSLQSGPLSNAKT